MMALELIWGAGDDCAYAESNTVGAWVERMKDPVWERWAWTLDTLEGCMPDDQETSLIAFGIEASKIAAIKAAERAVRAAEAAARSLCPA